MQGITPVLPRDTILERIEAISRELEDLRRLVMKTTPAPVSDNFTNELLGALGSEPLAAYDYGLDWERFNTQ